MSKSNTTTIDPQIVPEEFTKVLHDLMTDILGTFPEYKNNLDADLFNILETRDDDSVYNIYEYIKTVVPERFFDILYKNEEIFADNKINTRFLPGIDFKDMWKSDISEQTKDTLWKYLQIILFTIIGKVHSQESFGDTAKLFESINEDELKKKLEDTLGSLQNMMNVDEPVIDVSGIDHLPNPEQIQDHINGLLDGKLGRLAKEIAEETAVELNLDTENATSVNDIFKNLFKNPGKLMGLVKNVSGKLDEKIKSGEIKESEIMAEASGLLNKMKDMPGMGDIQSMLKKMGMGGRGGGGGGGGGNMDDMGDIQSMLQKMGMGGAGGKLNLGAMQNTLNQTMKLAQMKERVREKAAKKHKDNEIDNERLRNLPPTKPLTETELEELVFSIEGEKAEKSARTSSSNKNKKKKTKK